LAERTFCRHTPEVGAVCGKAARTVLCGGRSAMSVPTASKKKRPQRGGGALRPSGVLWETAEWLCGFRYSRPHPKSGALLTFAHRPNFKLRVSGRHRAVGTACFRRQWPSLKVSNFEQTIAVHICCLVVTGGLRCPDLIQRHQALLGLVALCFPGCPNSLTFRK
jgi:hypothetical protein